jgi:putative FmdB family regulatory protein
MPIYAYRCADCGHTKDVLQKLSDPPLAVCPACGAAAFGKQLTAAGFQLKGSGWYATDFKGGGTKPDAPAKDSGADKPAAPAATESGGSGSTPAAASTPAAGTGTGTGTGACGSSCACH